MTLLIVILNYRTGKLTCECLHSLKDKLDEVPGTRVLVVDNGSGDDSAAQIAGEIAANHWESWCELLALQENIGFAGGNNRGLQTLGSAYKDARYVLLLNSDTIIHPGALRYCQELMEKEPKIGMMSCLLLNADKSLQNVTRDFPSPLKQVICAFGLPWELPRLFGWANVYDVPDEMLKRKRDCDWLGGAFMYIRREALDKVGGGLDDSFFFYGEDIEFCHRFHKAGYRVHYDPTVSIMHVGGSSSDPTRVSSKQRNVYMWQARYQVQRKCYGAWAAWLVRGADIAAFGVRKVKMALTGKRHTDTYRTVSDALVMLLKPLREE
jgi:N-acetylglucosaminyl-diphospho-decaprenol L-rhamnosyltransferase